MMRGIRAGVRRLFRPALRSADRARADADDELRSFLDARVDDLVARGMPPDEARSQAVQRLGGAIDEIRVQLHRSAVHREEQMKTQEHLRDVAQDVRYAVRGLARTPGFTAVAVITLALGIGATTTIFSAVHALILRPLPFRDPARLMSVSLTTPADGNRQAARDDMVWSYPKFAVFRDGQTVFGSLALYVGSQFNVTSGEAERLRGEWVGADYLRTLGLTPQLGRDFDRAIEGRFGTRREAIISDALWQRRFNADPGVVGRTIDFGESIEIIGVTRPGFRGLTGQAEIFLPIATLSEREVGGPFAHQYKLVARRKPGVTAQRAAAEVAVLGARVDQAFSGFQKGTTRRFGAAARPLDDTRLAPLIKRSLLVLAGAVALVLLIACVNLANLLLGRASARRREVAIRLALGAGRERLLRLFLTEGVVLAMLGAAVSTLVAWWGTSVLRGLNPAAIAASQRMDTTAAVGLSSIQLDLTAFLFLLGIALIVGLLFGLAPALDTNRASLTVALKNGRGAMDAGPRTFVSGRRLLVVAEVALAILLLAGSGLMIRSLAKLLAIDPGFDPRQVLTMRLNIPQGGLARDSQPAFYTELLGRLGGLPSVSAVGLSNCMPLAGVCNFTEMEVMDGSGGEPSGVGVRWATPGFFGALRVPLERGRLFTDADRIGSPKVVLVTQTAGKRFWPNGDPIGKRVSVHQRGFADGAEVIGVVGDVRTVPDSLPNPDVYLPYAQSPQPSMIVYLRTAKDPASLAGAARRVVRELAPRYPVFDVETMSARVASATAQARFTAALLGAFAAVALALAVVGIYGVMALLVSQRTREIGIRMALGADRRRVMRGILGEGIGLAAAGALVGLGGALVLTRVLRTMLFDLSPSDPATYVTIVALSTLAAVIASWIPARRATRVDPMLALRAE
jgi:putative ABC transport system permease protein